MFDFQQHLQSQRDWSEKTFGPGTRTAGVIDHIRKELREIEADPTDVLEWIDVVILGLDGAWRAGFTPEQIIEAMKSKMAKNMAREWPDWRTMSPDKAIEHVRRESDELPPVHQPPIDRTIQTQFVDEGEHKPMPFPEEPSAERKSPRLSKCIMRTGDVDGLNYPCGVTGCPEPGHGDDVAELVRLVRSDWHMSRDGMKLADACERLAVKKVQLRLALKLLRDSLRVMPLDDGRLYFDDDFDATNFIENILKKTEQS